MRDGKGMLLEFNGSRSVETVTIEYRDRVRFVSCRAKEPLGLSSVLIRPDGFVAWASDGEPEEASMRKALDRWFGAVTTTRTP